MATYESNTYMQVRENAVILFPAPQPVQDTEGKAEHMREVQKRSYSGTVTAGVRKRMKKAITLMGQAVKPKWITNPVNQKMQYHRFSFITLTIANDTNVAAKDGYQILLKPFLRWLREKKDVKLYIWRAEPQKRGQLHYHLIIPEFIHHKEIRDEWNQIQRKAGLLTQWAMKHKNYNPPSTEIRETRHVKNMSIYIAKELVKTHNAVAAKARITAEEMIDEGTLLEEEKKSFIEAMCEQLAMNGKIWGCSDNLSGADYYTIPLSNDHSMLLRAYIRSGIAEKIAGDFWSVIYFTDDQPPDFLSTSEKWGLEDHINNIINKN